MTSAPAPRYTVLGVGISALTLARARDLIVASRGASAGRYVCLATVHGIVEAGSDPGFMRILNESWLTTADGMPLVWLGPRTAERVYGPDLLLAVCDAGRSVGLRHFFYGGAPGVADRLADRLSTRFPGLQVAGAVSPPYRELEEGELAGLADEVAASRADVVWVGLGTPKQERFMAGPGKALAPALLVGIGAAFDFHSGRKPQAPRWMQQSGLEWLFRLGTEPLRLGPRYLRTNALFLLRLVVRGRAGRPKA